MAKFKIEERRVRINETAFYIGISVTDPFQGRQRMVTAQELTSLIAYLTEAKVALMVHEEVQ